MRRENTVIPEKESDLKHYCALLFILLFHAVNNFLLLRTSGYMITPDDWSYFCFGKQLVALLRQGNGFGDLFAHIFGFWKPPLFMVSAVPFIAVHSSVKAAAMSNMIFLAVSLVAIYKIGGALYDKTTGLLAAFLFGIFPGSFAMSRVFFIEHALTAMVIVSFYLMLLNRFESAVFAGIFGAVIGLGLLTKQPYFVFLLPMLLYALSHSITDRRKTFNFLLMLAVGALVASPWYLGTDWKSLSFVVTGLTVAENDYATFYVQSLLLRQLYPVFFILFAAAVVRFAVKKEFFIPAIILGLLVVFSLSPNRVDRFIMPLLPFMALMISSTVVSFKRGRRWAVPALAVFGIGQYYLISYCPAPLRGEGPDRLFHQPCRPNYSDYGLYYYNAAIKPVSRENLRSILAPIREATAKNPRTSIVIASEYWPEMHYQLGLDSSFNWFAWLEQESLPLSDQEIRQKVREEIGRYDFIVIEKNLRWEERNRTKAIFIRCLEEKSREFDFIGARLFYPITLEVYKKRVVGASSEKRPLEML